MPGVRLESADGAGWTVETVELDLADRHGTGKRISNEPLGDGPQLLVRQHGHRVAYVARSEDLPALGIESGHMTVTSRSLTVTSSLGG